MNVVSAAVLVLFAVIGVIALVKDLTLFIFREKGNNSVMFVTPVKGKCENAEYFYATHKFYSFDDFKKQLSD